MLGAIRGVLIPMAGIATVSPCASCLITRELHPMLVVIIDVPTALNIEPREVTSVRRVPGDVGEDGKNRFVGEFENCENEISVRSR